MQVAVGEPYSIVNRWETSRVLEAIVGYWGSKVPPRLELGLLDSESRVLTITPWNPHLFAWLVTWVVLAWNEKLVG